MTEQLSIALVAAGGSLLGVVLATFVQGRRDRHADRRALRDDRIRRLAGEYECLLKLCVSTSDVIRQFEQWAGTHFLDIPMEIRAGWRRQIDEATRGANDAQIRLMLEETDQEVTIALNARPKFLTSPEFGPNWPR